MPKVTFLDPRGNPDGQTIEVAAGTSLLEASKDACAHEGSACGGVLACSTCHVWVKKGVASLDDQSDEEMDILDKAFDVRAYSRLGCQAEVTTEDLLVQVTEESERTWYDEHPKERHEAEAKGTWPPK